jgi:peptide/nickel transport system ATP-binding protein
MSICQIDNVSVTYSGATAPALDKISLNIKAGRRLAIIGESGSGKSTLAKLLANQLPKTTTQSGQVTWSLPTGERWPSGGKALGMIFQDPSAALNPLMTVGEQIGEAASFHLKLSKTECRELVLDLLGKLQLPEPQIIYQAYPHQLSGGQRQRVAIGAAISAGPSILISDEATSALDNHNQIAIIDLLNGLVKESGITLIAITHDIAVASMLSDDIAVMKDGRIIEQGPTIEVLKNPSQDYTAALLAANLDLNTPPLVRQRP